MLEQKFAIVTGSTSGIGLGLARELAQNGADVMLNGFGNPQEIEFTRAELERQYGVRVRCSDAELAALAVFLASDAAASMTGSALAMDGGWTQH